jgi:hypothetical protein
MMRFSTTGRDELLTHANGKRQISETAAMKMSQFAPTDAKLDSAELMGLRRHTRPRRDFTDDLLSNALAHI